MTAVLLEPPTRWWACPSCRARDRTTGPGVRFHPCPAVGLANVPFVEVTGPDVQPDGRHVLVAREDYDVDRTGSRWAAVRTERGDGSNDCTVFAPVARVEGRSR